MHPKTVVITGGPGTGKTSVVNLLAKKYPAMRESARLVLARNMLFKGKNAVQAKGKVFQEAIWDLEAKHYKKALLLKNRYVFFDRGFFDGFAYCKIFHLDNINGRIVQSKNIKYDYIFILDQLPKKFYALDAKRVESYDKAKKIHALIGMMYREYGYKPIRVPFDTVERRAAFILKMIGGNPH